MTYTLISRMKIILLIAVLAICGFFAYRDWFAVPEPPTPAPTPQVRLAPDGVYFVVKAFSIQTEDGIKGFPVLKEVRLVHQEGDEFVVTDGQAEGRAPRVNFSNNLDVVDRLRESLPPPVVQSPSTDSSPVTREIERISLEMVSANSRSEQLQAALKRTDTKIDAAGNRISRGEFYDSLTDLRELKKDLEKTREQLQAQLQYWEEMVSKLNRHKSALEETKRIANSLRNDAEDMERSRNEVARAEAEARASGSAVDSHKATSIRQ
jgi:hypothetical protein